jgi:hypothetical protein
MRSLLSRALHNDDTAPAVARDGRHSRSFVYRFLARAGCATGNEKCHAIDGRLRRFEWDKNARLKTQGILNRDH